jgi:hypothetical protein
MTSLFSDYPAKRAAPEPSMCRPGSGTPNSLPPTYVQAPGGQLKLVPLQIADLRGAEVMPIGDQNHRRVLQAVATERASGPN